MKASEYITKLSSMIEEYGDLDIARAYEALEVGEIIRYKDLDNEIFLV
jgi:hypothetical protein